MKPRLLPSQLLIVSTMFIAPVWLKWPFAPAPFTATYVLGFVVSAMMLLSVLCWAITGFPGWRKLFSDYARMGFLGALVLLTGWSFISQEWAFGHESYPGMAQNAALQLSIVTAFVMLILAVSPASRFILMALIFMMLLQGIVGSLQVYFQQSLGLSWLGEFELSVQHSGVSVLEANGLRWLRPYGLTPHPNIFAGIILLGLFASAAFVVQNKYRIFSMIAFLLGFFFLLLSFSRGAWIGFVAASVFAAPFLMRESQFWRRILPLTALSFLIAVVFAWFYQPFLLSRTGLNEQNTEQRSISDRLVFMEIAWDAIENYPYQGLGAGNFPWYASNYLYFRTDYELRGNNVHNVYLTVWTELGLIGLGLFLIMLATGTLAVLQNRNPERIALLAGVLAWAIIGFVDHYSWTLILTHCLWLGLFAAAIAKESKASYNGKTDS